VLSGSRLRFGSAAVTVVVFALLMTVAADAGGPTTTVPETNLPVLAKSSPPIVAGGQWFNSKPLTLSSLRGRVVLLDFWTYSCINCLRTLPHLEAWYADYHREGFEIIGVHSPEFAFEHVASNVQDAIRRLGIKYPVVQDNAFATWTEYGNTGWPTDYLIDQDGQIRATQTGEGGYLEMQQAIEQLLGVATTGVASTPDLTPLDDRTTESYLGYGQLDTSRYVGRPIVRNQLVAYPARKDVPLDDLAYSGYWQIGSEAAVAGTNAVLTLHFQGESVYLVAAGTGRITVSLKGRPVKTIRVHEDELYTLESFPEDRTGVLRLAFTPGVQAYDFTFG
jgi:thiol-disulfide isomerase/thioredoxin